MNDKNKAEAERRAKLLKMRAERLPDIKKAFEENRKGEMVHHQRMLSQDVNAQATQHIIGIPVNKSRYNGYNGQQITMAQIKQARQHRDAVRVIPIGGLGEFGIGKKSSLIWVRFLQAKIILASTIWCQIPNGSTITATR